MIQRDEGLTVLYDEDCGLCRRCREWLVHQQTFVPVSVVAAHSAEARGRFGLVPWLGAELVVVGPDDEVWVGGAAFLVCLWATVRYREWSYRLSGPRLAPLAASFFELVSHNRRILRFLGCRDATCSGRGWY